VPLKFKPLQHIFYNVGNFKIPAVVLSQPDKFAKDNNLWGVLLLIGGIAIPRTVLECNMEDATNNTNWATFWVPPLVVEK
jgi:hypothetical protein